MAQMRTAPLLALVLACTQVDPSSGAASFAASPVLAPRLVILGFDGVDPRRVDALVRAGRLPHLATLGQAGYRGPLRSTNPPQSPVAWATFATGAHAGHHGIFDFVGRNP